MPNMCAPFWDIKRSYINTTQSSNAYLNSFFIARRCYCFIQGTVTLQVVPADVHHSKSHYKHENFLVAENKLFQVVHGHYNGIMCIMSGFQKVMNWLIIATMHANTFNMNFEFRFVARSGYTHSTCYLMNRN